MRRPLTADPIFYVMVDAESALLGCSAPAIIRCGTLEFLARNHQTRIPSMFREEREISIFQNLFAKALHPLSPIADDKLLKELKSIPADQLRLAIFDAITQAMEKERERLFKRTRPRI